jgi:short-subunit dehydrogenase
VQCSLAKLGLSSASNLPLVLKEKYGRLALVAGASEGIGAAFATALAAAGMDLILVARRMELLQTLASSLSTRYSVHVDCISCDHADSAAPQQLQQATAGREIGLLVYNAAIPYIGYFERDSPEHHTQMAQANMITPMLLTQLFGIEMLARGRGAVILMASLAGFQGSGFLTTYAASKAFDRVLAESLWYEWKDRGVDVIACCAGATSTPNYVNTKPEKSSPFAPRVQTPEEVVRECLDKLGKVPSFVTGTGNKIASFFMQRLMPRRVAITIMGDTARKMYRL